jgi:DNA-binding NtrC family response regulator
MRPALKPAIVCVDDNPLVLACVSRVLAPLGVVVLTTNDPETALAWISKQEIAAVIADVDMPAMSGIELVTAVRRVRPDTVRVLLTGMQTFDTAVAGINRGEVFRHLTKPVEPAELRQTVVAAVLRHRELADLRRERARASRRDQMRVALEREFPAITRVAREGGAYRIAAPSPASLAGLGLDAIFALRRQG